MTKVYLRKGSYVTVETKKDKDGKEVKTRKIIPHGTELDLTEAELNDIDPRRKYFITSDEFKLEAERARLKSKIDEQYIETLRKNGLR